MQYDEESVGYRSIKSNQIKSNTFICLQEKKHTVYTMITIAECTYHDYRFLFYYNTACAGFVEDKGPGRVGPFGPV
jgi:hypothetical protein